MTAEGKFISSRTRSPESKEPFIRRLFDTFSRRYDLFNRISSFGMDQKWRRQTVARLRLTPEMQVLDLASGTGDLAVLAARQLVPLGKVTACDLSLPMLATGRRKLRKEPALSWHIGYAQARAEALPFSDRFFDAAVMGFALRNVSDLNATFREFARVLKPGCRLSLLEFGRPKGFLLGIGHRLWLTFGVPLLGLLITGSIWPFLYLRRSILQFLPSEEVVVRLKQFGFSEVKAEPLDGGIVFIYSGVRD